MSAFTTADRLHRLIKQALDSGQASTIAEAESLFAGYRVALHLDHQAARDRHHQAALLTAVALARRVFLGGVTVDAPPDVPLLAPMPFGNTLGEALVRLGAQLAPAPQGTARIEVGGPPAARQGDFHIRMLFAGWRGGVVPADADTAPEPRPVMSLSPMLSAAF
ncbi:MAG: hypothetical protein JSS43_17895, partial [Proteobacteria bacterium]|nr:hypothetical protein [Pseudomonadota bacterium]